MRSKKAPKNLAEIQIPKDLLTLLDVKQTQAILNCSRGSINDMIRSGELSSIKILSSKQSRRSDVEKFIATQARKPSSRN